MAAATMVKLEPAGEDDESWLYGNSVAEGSSPKATDPKPAASTEVALESRLSAEAVVFEPRRKSDAAEPPTPMVETPEVASSQSNVDIRADAENLDDDDSEDDDVQVTIGDIKSQPFDSSLPKFKTPYQQQHSQGSMTASKPPAKGIDLDAVGTVSGVPVYEFDMESIKMEDKPWRKPGADITDYFNYGFNEDTWTKYCEKQRRLRIENNSHKSGNLIFVHGSSSSHRPEPAKSVDSVNSGEMNSYSGPSSVRKMNNHQPMHKISSTIDVIGSTTRDSRRPQPQDFPDPGGNQSEYQQISSVTTMMPMSMSVPPPMLNMPPPDFGMPPPPGSLPPGAMAPPPHMGPPPGLIAPPPILVGPPPGFPPPQMGGPGFDPFFRGGPGGPPPPHDRRPPPGFPDRPPPFGFDGPYGPPPFGAPPGAPPSWDNRAVDNYNMERGGGGGGGSGGGVGASNSGDRAPPNWDFRGVSPARSDTDFSSSAGDDHERRTSPSRKHRGREAFEHQERESRQRDRSRSRDRSRLRESERDRGKDTDRDRNRDSRDRGRESERDRGGRESTRARDSERDRERSRDHERHRGRGSRERDRKESYERDRRHHREKEDRHHSRRREEDEDRHKTKHKKEKKVKQEPMDDDDDAPGSPAHSEENTKA